MLKLSSFAHLFLSIPKGSQALEKLREPRPLSVYKERKKLHKHSFMEHSHIHRMPASPGNSNGIAGRAYPHRAHSSFRGKTERSHSVPSDGEQQVCRENHSRAIQEGSPQASGAQSQLSDPRAQAEWGHRCEGDCKPQILQRGAEQQAAGGYTRIFCSQRPRLKGCEQSHRGEAAAHYTAPE